MRVFTPSMSNEGWSAGGHSVVEVITDDMPFLVDSLTTELARQQRDVHVVVHPRFDVVRDITGELQSVHPVEDGSTAAEPGALRESWMHIEVSARRRGRGRRRDRGPAPEGAARRPRVRRGLGEDAGPARAIVRELDEEPPPLDPDEVRRGQELLQWLAADHFTFLGYREYRLVGEGEDEYLRAVPGTGLGILRADQDMSASFAKLPHACGRGPARIGPQTCEGTFYVWLKLPTGVTTETLLSEHRVALSPGEGFGPSGAEHARLSLAVSDETLELGLERLAAAFGSRARPARLRARRPEPPRGRRTRLGSRPPP